MASDVVPGQHDPELTVEKRRLIDLKANGDADQEYVSKLQDVFQELKKAPSTPRKVDPDETAATLSLRHQQQNAIFDEQANVKTAQNVPMSPKRRAALNINASKPRLSGEEEDEKGKKSSKRKKKAASRTSRKKQTNKSENTTAASAAASATGGGRRRRGVSASGGQHKTRMRRRKAIIAYMDEGEDALIDLLARRDSDSDADDLKHNETLDPNVLKLLERAGVSLKLPGSTPRTELQGVGDIDDYDPKAQGRSVPTNVYNMTAHLNDFMVSFFDDIHGQNSESLKKVAMLSTYEAFNAMNTKREHFFTLVKAFLTRIQAITEFLDGNVLTNTRLDTLMGSTAEEEVGEVKESIRLLLKKVKKSDEAADDMLWDLDSYLSRRKSAEVQDEKRLQMLEVARADEEDVIMSGCQETMESINSKQYQKERLLFRHMQMLRDIRDKMYINEMQEKRDAPLLVPEKVEEEKRDLEIVNVMLAKKIEELVAQLKQYDPNYHDADLHSANSVQDTPDTQNTVGELASIMERTQDASINKGRKLMERVRELEEKSVDLHSELFASKDIVKEQKLIIDSLKVVLRGDGLHQGVAVNPILNASSEGALVLNEIAHYRSSLDDELNEQKEKVKLLQREAEERREDLEHSTEIHKEVLNKNESLQSSLREEKEKVKNLIRKYGIQSDQDVVTRGSKTFEDNLITDIKQKDSNEKDKIASLEADKLSLQKKLKEMQMKLQQKAAEPDDESDEKVAIRSRKSRGEHKSDKKKPHRKRRDTTERHPENRTKVEGSLNLEKEPDRVERKQSKKRNSKGPKIDKTKGKKEALCSDSEESEHETIIDSSSEEEREDDTAVSSSTHGKSPKSKTANASSHSRARGKKGTLTRRQRMKQAAPSEEEVGDETDEGCEEIDSKEFEKVSRQRTKLGAKSTKKASKNKKRSDGSIKAAKASKRLTESELERVAEDASDADEAVSRTEDVSDTESNRHSMALRTHGTSRSGSGIDSGSSSSDREQTTGVDSRRSLNSQNGNSQETEALKNKLEQSLKKNGDLKEKVSALQERYSQSCDTIRELLLKTRSSSSSVSVSLSGNSSSATTQLPVNNEVQREEPIEQLPELKSVAETDSLEDTYDGADDSISDLSDIDEVNISIDERGLQKPNDLQEDFGDERLEARAALEEDVGSASRSSSRQGTADSRTSRRQTMAGSIVLRELKKKDSKMRRVTRSMDPNTALEFELGREKANVVELTQANDRLEDTIEELRDVIKTARHPQVIIDLRLENSKLTKHTRQQQKEIADLYAQLSKSVEEPETEDTSTESTKETELRKRMKKMARMLRWWKSRWEAREHAEAQARDMHEAEVDEATARDVHSLREFHSSPDHHEEEAAFDQSSSANVAISPTTLATFEGGLDKVEERQPSSKSLMSLAKRIMLLDRTFPEATISSEDVFDSAISPLPPVDGSSKTSKISLFRKVAQRIIKNKKTENVQSAMLQTFMNSRRKLATLKMIDMSTTLIAPSSSPLPDFGVRISRRRTTSHVPRGAAADKPNQMSRISFRMPSTLRQDHDVNTHHLGSSDHGIHKRSLNLGTTLTSLSPSPMGGGRVKLSRLSQAVQRRHSQMPPLVPRAAAQTTNKPRGSLPATRRPNRESHFGLLNVPLKHL